MTAEQHAKLMRMLVGDNCFRSWVLRQQPTAGSSAGALASYAKDHLTCALQCLMVGMERDALELLAKSDEWMTPALVRAAAGEEIELEYWYHFRHAVCRWLIGPPVGVHDLTRACELLQASEAMTLANAGAYAQELDHVLPLWLSAGRYAECIAKYEQCGAKYPPPRKRQQCEAAMAYFLARERLHSSIPEQDIQQKLHLFLREQVPTLLKYGRYDRFALWVQIISRAEAGAPARAAIRQIADQYA
jgi:hypothetical protein